VLAQLVRWLITAFGPGDPRRRRAVIEAAVNGQAPTGMPAYAATLLARYAPVAHTATSFYRELQTRSRDAVYPEQEIRQALSQLRTDDRLR